MPSLAIDAISDGAAFEAGFVEIMGAAFELACCNLHDDDRGPSDLIRKIVARQILILGETGERDPQKLADGALKSITFERDH